MNSGLINNSTIIIILGGLLAVMGIALIISVIRGGFKSGNKLIDRLDEFVMPPTQTTDRRTRGPIIPREIEGSLFRRTIQNWFANLLHFLGRYTPQSITEDLEHKLAIAGNPGNLQASEFYAIRFLILLGGIVLAFFLNRDFAHLSTTSILIGLLVVFIALLLPNAWLNSQVRNKKNEISRGLPDVLDMLSVCASAGLGFDQSLQKISTYWTTELGKEFQKTVSEMEMGVPRITALKNMSARLEVEDLTRFISIITQAEAIGMSYADVLHNQAEQMRIMRQYRAKEMVNQLPAKMIIPLAICIFPAVLAVILGPTIPRLLSVF